MNFRSFGRRKGRKLRPFQQGLVDSLLPKIELRLGQISSHKNSVYNLFYNSTPCCEVHLEIGFGAGEYLLWRAEQLPRVYFIGAEPFQNGIAKCLSSMVTRWGYDQTVEGNVRIFPDDARDLLSKLPDHCLARVDIPFPDPWQKLRHSRRRLINAHLLSQLLRVIKPGGSLCIATDHEGYLCDILCKLHKFSQFRWQVKAAKDWREPFFGYETRYAEKARSAGRKGYYLHYRRDEYFCLSG